MENEIKDYIAHSDNIVRTMKIPLVILDRNFRIKVANKAFYRNFHFSREKLVNKSFNEIGNSQFYIDELINKIKKVLSSNEKFDSLEISQNFPFAGNRILLFSGRQIVCRATEEKTVLLVIEDITEKRKLQERLYESLKIESIGVMSGGVSANFRKIFKDIISYSDESIENILSEEKVRDFIKKMVTQSEKALEILDQISPEGECCSQKESIDFSDLIKNMASLLDGAVSDRCNLKYNLDRNLPSVYGCKLELRQAILNLVTNGSEAIGDEKGNIIIDTFSMKCDQKYLAKNLLDENLSEGDYVIIKVSDRGSGIPDEIHSRLFVPFFSTKDGHYGLGLTYVMNIVRKHKGAINFFSDSERGTVFKLMIPALKNKE